MKNLKLMKEHFEGLNDYLNENNKPINEYAEFILKDIDIALEYAEDDDYDFVYDVEELAIFDLIAKYGLENLNVEAFKEKYLN